MQEGPRTEPTSGRGAGERTASAVASISRDEHLAAIHRLRREPKREHAHELIRLALADPPGSRAAHHAVRELPGRRVRSGELELNNLKMARPLGVFEPRSVGELAELARRAAEERVPLKAVGAAYALSDIDATRGYLVNLGTHLTAVRPAPAAALKASKRGETHYEIEAGATIDRVNETLWARGHALLNQPGFGSLSFVGVSSVGGHGSGIELQGIAESIRSIRVLGFDKDGRLRRWQVEARDGITDPDLYADTDGFELLQDDDLFHSLKVGLGALGVICSVVVAARPSYHLEEVRTYEPWSRVAKDLPGLLADKSLQSIAIWLSPYPGSSGEPMCLLGKYTEVTRKPDGGRRGLGIIFGGSNVVADMIVWWVAHAPGSLPALMDAALESSASRSVMPCTEALSFGPPNNLHVLASACGIDAARTIDAVQHILALVERMKAKGCYVTSPIGLRFVAPGEGYMSPQYDRASCMIEMPILAGTEDSETTLDAFQEEMSSSFDARPHWGQHVRIDGDRARARFPKYDAFKKAAAFFGAAGRFSNKRLHALGLADPGPPPGSTRAELLLGEAVPRWQGLWDRATSNQLGAVGVAMLGLMLWGLHGAAPLLGWMITGYEGPGSDPATRPRLLPGIAWDNELLSFAFGAVACVGLPALAIRLLLAGKLKDYGLAPPRREDLGVAIKGSLILFGVLVLFFVPGARARQLYELYPLFRGPLAGMDLVLYECAYLLFFVALEGVLRGVLLFGLASRDRSPDKLPWVAIGVETLVQAVWHLGKPPMEAWPSPIWGVAAGCLAYRCRSVWPVVLTHWALCVAVDLSCLHAH